MLRGAFLFLLLLLIGPTFASAQDGVGYAPIPEWVVDPAYPAEPTDATKGSSASNLLSSFQFYSGKTGPGIIFERRVFRVNDASGLRALGTIQAQYAEGRNRLTIHHARIIRNGTVIDLLTDGKSFATFRNEGEARSGVIAGVVTAYLQIPDLRVGDIIDYALSTETTIPLFLKHFEGHISLLSPGSVDRLHYRINWDKARPLNVAVGKRLPQATAGEANGLAFMEGSVDNLRLKGFDNGLPQRLAADWMIIATSRNSWSELVDDVEPVYRKAIEAELSGDLVARIEAIRAENASPAAQAMAALRLVQGEIRYIGNFEGLGSHQPDSAQKVWDQRFGDCKGKSVLLIAILRRLGINAIPALVSSTKPGLVEAGKGLVSTFDHVIVRADIAGDVVWLDGTRLSDRDLATLEIPDFRFALPLVPGADLQRLPPVTYPRPTETTHYEIDASQGFDVPAAITSVTTYRGEGAAQFSASLAMLSDQQKAEQEEETIKQSEEEDFKVTAVRYFDRPDIGESGFEMTGSMKLEWTEVGDFSEWFADMLQIGQDLAVEREDPMIKDLPVAVSAAHYEVTVSAKLPEQGKAYSLSNKSFERKIGPATYKREVKIDGRQFTARTVTQIAQGELAVAEAEKYDKASDVLYEDKVYVMADKAGMATQKTERSIVANAKAKAASGDVDGALADMAAEIKLRPQSTALIVGRAQILKDAGRPGVERELQKALLIDSDHREALEMLARLYADEGDIELADAITERIRKAHPTSGWLKEWPKLRKALENSVAGKEPALAAF